MDRQKKIQLLKDLESGRITVADLNKKPLNFRFKLMGDTYRDDLSGIEMSLAEINALDINTPDPTLITRLDTVRTNGEITAIRISSNGKFLSNDSK